jgi:3',5'-cyclic AMP phosphodiesterase CpdA
MSSYHFLHLSDLHFGRIHDPVLDDLKKFISAQKNLNLIIVTGDLTQRARFHQFLPAKVFIESLKVPIFVIPGNHDVPLYHLFFRFFRPYHKYRKAMGALAERFYEDKQVAVFGLWTVNPFKIESGRLDLKQVKWVEEKIKNISAPKEKWKIIACHHPPETLKSEAVQRLLALKPDLILWGHDHQSRAFYANEAKEQWTVMLAAGTSISSRTRREANSFNSVHFKDHEITVEVFTHSTEGAGFSLTQTHHFQRHS